jgi:predicted dehydrogenase
MMSEVAFFVKDVVGPDGCASIVAPKASSEGQSANVDAHTQTQIIRRHFSELDENGKFTKPDEQIDITDEPDHDALCRREQEFFLKAIREDLDLNQQYEDILNSMRIVAAADESYRTGKTVEL